MIDDDGQLSVGRIAPVPCLAVANDEYSTYAILVRRDDESLVDLMTRLDAGVAKAIDEDICIDEINPPSRR